MLKKTIKTSKRLHKATKTLTAAQSQCVDAARVTLQEYRNDLMCRSKQLEKEIRQATLNYAVAMAAGDSSVTVLTILPSARHLIHNHAEINAVDEALKAIQSL